MSSILTNAPGSKSKRSRRELTRSVGLVVLAVLATLFAVLNLKTVEVDWIFGSGHAPLIIVIVDLRARRRRVHALRRAAHGPPRWPQVLSRGPPAPPPRGR